jgi:hypothetical protein
VRRAPFYGWVVVGAAFSVLFMAYGAQFSFGVYFSALLEEFGWSRTDLFGRGHAGGLVGLLSSTAGSTAAWSPLGAGFIYDRSGSYRRLEPSL